MVTTIALGDSATPGTPDFTSPVEAPPNGMGNVQSQYAYWLMKTHPDWRVLNRGVNGERSDQVRTRFERDLRDLIEERGRGRDGPVVVVIVAGVNDIYQGRGADLVGHELGRRGRGRRIRYGLSVDFGRPLVQSVFRSVARRRSGEIWRGCELAAPVTEKRMALNRGRDASPIEIES